MKEHRWSGWPGAFCLDCGMEDQFEIALADGTMDPMTGQWDDREREDFARWLMEDCPVTRKDQ